MIENELQENPFKKKRKRFNEVSQRTLFWFIGIPTAMILGFFAFIKVQERLGIGESNDSIPRVGWRILSELNVQTGEMPDKLKKLSGRMVRIPGFMVPLEDKQQIVKEFLLVPYAGACIHVPPPPPNQMVHVLMESGSEAVFTWEPIWVTGELKISASESPYGKVSFSMVGKTAKTIKPEDGK